MTAERTGGLLAVHAHPDDETLSGGALLATWAAADCPVTVVTCTRGEQGEVIPERLRYLAGDPDALAVHRERELAEALVALGVGDHVFLDQVPFPGAAPTRYADSGMAWVDSGTAGPATDVPDDAFVAAGLDEAARRLAAVIEDRRPDVVVTYEPGGGYGHPDHVQAHRVTHRAVELAEAAGARVPVVLWAAQDEVDVRRGTAEVERRAESSLPVPDRDAPMPSAVVPPALVDLRVPLAPVLGRVEAALRAHESQVQALETWVDGGGAASGCFALSNDLLMPLLAVECCRYADGRTVGSVVWPAGVRTGGR